MLSYVLFVILMTSYMYVQYGAGVCVSDKTCNGHGTCILNNMTCNDCKCTNNYTGIYCQIPPDCTPQGNQCHYGNCNYKTLKCECYFKYTGRYCHIPPICTESGDECGQYGECDTCSSDRVNYCRCNTGYGGVKCEKPPACTDGGRECQNRGVCDFTKKPFVCSCLPGFNGTTCGGAESTGDHVTAVTTTLMLTQIAAFMCGRL